MIKMLVCLLSIFIIGTLVGSHDIGKKTRSTHTICFN